jgi:hypothetical protein
MKKAIFLLIVVTFLAIFLKTEAQIFNEPEEGKAYTTRYYGPLIKLDSDNDLLGGKITATKAVKIETLEASGYTCYVDGKTIQTNPIVKGSDSYIIPLGIKSKTGYETKEGQWIIGYTFGEEIVECIYCTPGGCVYQYPRFPRLVFFGTSK